ncbi:MAG: alpha/beta hydrolase, partial [Alphaproteobacteria bacterium]
LFGSDLHARYARRFGSTDYRRAGALRGTFLKAVNEDLSAIARAIEVPVLLIYGSEDRETPPEIGTRFAALMPRAELHLLDGFGHLDILGRGAYQCEHLIARFLERHAR